MQVLPDPAGSSDDVLRVQLFEDDMLDDGSGSTPTTRVELAADRSKGDFTTYVPGDDLYFAFSVYFPSASFDHWHCKNLPTPPLDSNSTGLCPNGVPDTPDGIYSAWNVVTQWHSPGDPSMGFTFQRLYESGNQQYQLSLQSYSGSIWHDTVRDGA